MGKEWKRRKRMRLIDADTIDFSKAFGGQSEFAKDLIAAEQGCRRNGI